MCFINKLEIRFIVIVIYVDGLNFVETLRKLTRVANYLKMIPINLALRQDMYSLVVVLQFYGDQ